MLRGSRGVALLLCLLLLAAVPAAAFYYYEPLPRSFVGLLRPVISQRFVLGEGESFQTVKMWLDGAEVPAVSDSAAGTVSYTPPGPLAAGTHPVRLEVTVSPSRAGVHYSPLRSDFSFTVAADALAELPGPGPDAQQVLNRVNLRRVAAGLPLMGYSLELGAAAQRHAAYQAALGSLTHTEIPGRALFFGETTLDRALYYCYRGNGVAEVIATAETPDEAVDGWMAALYHRLPLLAPGSSELGYGAAGALRMSTIHVVETGPCLASTAEVAWPPPGAIDVPCSWEGNESPDPLRLYPGTSGPLGYTITLSFGRGTSSLILSVGRLLDPAGAEVPVLRYSRANDTYLTDVVALIPRRPLLPSATYRVEFEGSVDLGQGTVPFGRSWSFTTAGGQAFWDLPPASPAYDAVSLLVSRGVVNGYEDGSFRPGGNVTRAEFAKLLTVASGWQVEPGAALGFADTAGHWAAAQGYLQAAVRQGAISGFPDGTFRPQGLVKRSEAVKMAAAATGLQAAGVPGYIDVDPEDWYAGWVAAARNSRLIGAGARWPLWTGVTFGGDLPLTRAEAAILIGNLLLRSP